MTHKERLEAAITIVRGLPGDGADQLTIVMLALTMAMRLSARGDQAKYERMVQSVIALMEMAPESAPPAVEVH